MSSLLYKSLVVLLLVLITALAMSPVPRAATARDVVPGELPMRLDDPEANDPLGAQSGQNVVYLEQQKVIASGSAGDQFGFAVAVDGNTALVGAPYDNADTGSVYVFAWDGRFWTFQQQLFASDGQMGDEFGHAVALAGDTILVGAYGDDSGRGAAYVFARSGSIWAQQGKLRASDGEAYDYFGFAVALDADTALVGAYRVDVGANDEQGAAYVFTRSGTSWTEQQKLLASDGAILDHFGKAVALDGDTVLVGAPEYDSSTYYSLGAAYVFTRSGTVWTEQDQLLASDGASADRFGISVALDADTALVGAYGDDDYRGSAYIFTRGGTAWTEQQKLVASDRAGLDQFGFSVALSGDTVLVGAPYDDARTGSAYVFTHSGTGWTEQYQLAASGGVGDGWFGQAVALSGDTALVGAPLANAGANEHQGSVYTFTRSGAVWSEQQQLTGTEGAAGDYFGYAVALDGDTALVGAYGVDVDSNANQGSAYVFIWNGTAWTLQQKLLAPDGAPSDFFGCAVALSGDTALVGASGDDDYRGAAYVFTRSGAVWSFQQKLTAAERWLNSVFGLAVALDGDTALVGAYGTDDRQGAAYLFARSGTTWNEEEVLIAADGAADDYFGYSVALDGDTALVGAYGGGINPTDDRGSAYIFTRSGTAWTEQAKLLASDGGLYDLFGSAVALDGDTALVGAPNADISGTADRGAAYIFTRSGTSWTEQQKLVASNGLAFDFTGAAVALEGDAALVGSPGDDNNRATVFLRSGTTWAEQGTLTASDGSDGERFGGAVALSGDKALVGSCEDSVGLQLDQGSAYFFRADATPVVTSITRMGSNPTAEALVWFNVVFSEAVTGVSMGDFAVVTTGTLSGVSVGGTRGYGSSYIVTAVTGTGDGTLRLVVPESATITDLAGLPLSDLPYTSGQAYTIDRTPPTVVAITRADANPTSAATVAFDVTFSEAVTGVDAGDFVLTAGGTLSGASVDNVSGSGASYAVTVSTGTGEGTLRLDMPADVTVADLIGITLAGLPYTDGEAYLVERAVEEEFYLFLPMTVQDE